MWVETLDAPLERYVARVEKVYPLLTQRHFSRYIIYHSLGPTQQRAKTELWPTEIVPDKMAEYTHISSKRESESRPLGIS